MANTTLVRLVSEDSAQDSLEQPLVANGNHNGCDSCPSTPHSLHLSPTQSVASCHSISDGEDTDSESQSRPISPCNMSYAESDRWTSDGQTDSHFLSGNDNVSSLKLAFAKPKTMLAHRLSRRLPSRRKAGHPRYKLIQEGDVQLCRLNHRRTLISKIMNSRYLRRWETHHLILGDGVIESTTVCTYLKCYY